MRFKQSIRWQLPLSYAGIAFITTAILGLLMMAILEDYYRYAELENLTNNAKTISQILARDSTPISSYINYSDLSALAHAMDVQLELLDVYQNVIFDSGVGDTVYLQLSSNYDSLTSSVIPAGSIAFDMNGDILEVTTIDDGMFGFSYVAQPISISRTLLGAQVAQPVEATSAMRIRSNEVVKWPIFRNQYLLGFVQLSNSVSAGYEIIETVQNSWMIAGVVAGGLAAVIGILVGHQITQPLRKLTHAVNQFTQNDLSVRVNLKRWDEFGKLANTFDHMAEKVENTVSTLRNFVADASHEIHTPLTAIRTNLELYLENHKSPTIIRALKQVDRLQHLADNLLDLSRLEGALHSTVVSPVNMTRLVYKLGEIYASRAEQAEIHFDLSIPKAPLLYVEGDPEQLQRVLMNLLDNALKFTPEDGQIHLKLTQEQDYIVISVQDNGIGIPPEDQPYLFNRFKRGINTANYPGNGLGLAIVQAIVTRHQGMIAVQSDAKGTCFSVKFPLLINGLTPRK
jgi:signal transduction histidine kinase